MARDRQVLRTADDYAAAMADLLPRGRAWPRDRDSVLMKVVRGLCAVWEVVEERANTLLRVEADPRATISMLEDWERNFGLPDPCYAEPLTVGDRQNALVQRMTIEGGQSRQFFIDAAAEIGHTIQITEYRPFMVGLDRVGDNRELLMTTSGHYTSGETSGDFISGEETYSEWPAQIGPPEMRFYWSVDVGGVRLTWFRAATGQAGVDPHLQLSIASDLECLIRRWKPAHTEVIFDYSGIEFNSDPMADTP